MKLNPKFSVTIPAFKTRFLRECIDSILIQTFKNFEIIILNDCSPENVEEIISLYDDKRIHYFKNERNVGAYNVVDNWNKCLDLCSGEFVICMGDDDLLAQDCLEQYCKLIDKYPLLDAYHGRTAIINEKGDYTYIVQDRAEYENIYSFIRHRLDGWGLFIGDFCYRTKALKEAGGYYKQPLAWGSDDITAYMMIGEKGIANTKDVVFKYRVSTQTISEDSNVEIKLMANIKTFEWIKTLVYKSTPPTLADVLTREVILKELPLRLKIWQEFALRHGIKKNKLKLFKYIVYRKKFKLSLDSLLIALYRSLK